MPGVRDAAGMTPPAGDSFDVTPGARMLGSIPSKPDQTGAPPCGETSAQRWALATSSRWRTWSRTWTARSGPGIAFAYLETPPEYGGHVIELLELP